MSSDYTIGNGTITNIANAIRAQEGSVGTIQVSDFANRISAIVPTTQKTGDISNINTEYYGISANTISAIGNAIKYQDGESGPVSGFARRILALIGETPWERPSEWPDYDKLGDTDDAIFLTVDTTLITTNNKLGVDSKTLVGSYDNWFTGYRFWDNSNGEPADTYVTANTGLRVERGHITNQGAFAVDEVPSLSTWTRNRDKAIYWEVPTDQGRYLVYKLYGIANNVRYFWDTLHIQQQFGESSNAGIVIEAWGRANYMTNMSITNRNLVSFDVKCPGTASKHLKRYPVYSYKQYDSTTALYPSLVNYNIKALKIYPARYSSGGTLLKILYFKDLHNLNRTLDFTKMEVPSGTIYYTDDDLGRHVATFDGSGFTKIKFAPRTLSWQNNDSNRQMLTSFSRMPNCTRLDLSPITIEIWNRSETQQLYFDSTFEYSALEEITCPTIILHGGYVSYFSTFRYCSNLKEIYNVPDVNTGKTNSYRTIDIQSSSNLSRDTVLRFFNTVSTAIDASNFVTFKFNSNLQNRLTNEDIAIATDKGHTVTFS